MAVLTEIRKRPWLLMGGIAIALLAFLVNPDSLEQVFGKNPNILGKVNGVEITRDEYNDQLMVLQQQAQSQGQPASGLEEQAWKMMVQSKLIEQEFEKMGLSLTDEVFWKQLQFDPMFAQNPQNFDAKGNFKSQEIKKSFEEMKTNGNVEQYNNWLRTKKSIQYRMMARMLFANINAGITANKKEAAEFIKQRDQLANIDAVKIDYATFEQKNPVKVTTQDLADFIKERPIVFKSDATRNLGVVYFPAKPSAQDDAAALNEINKLNTVGTDLGNGIESFQNTKNDSMFVTINSEMGFNPMYFSKEQLPQGIKDQIATASIGQSFGPYKEQNYYVISKLLDKKASDSTLSSHILIAYKGAERSTATRSKDEAKAIAEKVLTEVKSNPAKFNENLKLSDEPGAPERGGSVGWTTPETPFAAGYLNFLSGNSKGSIGLAETPFGYHIIKIDDKKSGAMTYKVANLVKEIKPSKETQDKVYSQANTFIQSVQGKSFNDFANAAKKQNFQFSNPKALTRFQGQIPGLGTDKDEEILSWSFNKDRNKGDIDIKTTGNGDYIVFYLNGKHDGGTAEPESVREQIEPIVKNKILAKKIMEKITAAKATSLDQIAKLFGTQKQSAQINMLNPMMGMTMEPKVAGAAFGLAKGKTSKPIEGTSGVFVVMNNGIVENKQPGDLKQMAENLQKQNAQNFSGYYLKSLEDNAKIEDYRIEVWDKANAAQ